MTRSQTFSDGQRASALYGASSPISGGSLGVFLAALSRVRPPIDIGRCDMQSARLVHHALIPLESRPSD